MLKSSNNRNNLKNTFIFILLTFISIALNYYNELSFIKYTFKPIEVFLHESGHLLTSLMLGGEIVNLHLEFGSGYVTHKIGFGASIVSFMGYFSASMFGFLIYISSLYNKKALKVFLILYCSFFFIYIRDLTSLLVLTMIISIFISSWFLKSFGMYLIRFIGVYVMVSSIYSPTYLWSYTDEGDHISMSSHTMIPSLFFIILWFLIGIFFFYKAFKYQRNFDKNINIEKTS